MIRRWPSLWAFFEPHNVLFRYLQDDRKVTVVTKLCICCWNLHPITNILSFSRQARTTDKCIAFYYNGSIISQANAKLGFTK